MSFDIFFLMSHSTKPSFSVAKFAIEGIGQGMDPPHKGGSVPPRLPDSRTTPLPKADVSFPINPFSLSCSSTSNSYSICSTASQSFLANVPDSVFPSAPLSLASVSSLAHPLFPNPFLLKQNSNLYSQPAPLFTPKSLTESAHSSVPQIVAQPAQSFNTLPSPNLPTTTTLSIMTRKPRKPWPDHILASSPFRPRVMAADRLFSWRTPYGLSPAFNLEVLWKDVEKNTLLADHPSQLHILLKLKKALSMWTRVTRVTRLPLSLRTIHSIANLLPCP